MMKITIRCYTDPVLELIDKSICIDCLVRFKCLYKVKRTRIIGTDKGCIKILESLINLSPSHKNDLTVYIERDGALHRRVVLNVKQSYKYKATGKNTSWECPTCTSNNYERMYWDKITDCTCELCKAVYAVIVPSKFANLYLGERL